MTQNNKSAKQIKEEKFNFNVATWCNFWRHNPHRFLTDFLGVPLFIFQQIIIFMMFKNDLILFLASRGLGKSYLTACFSIARCILFPKTSIVITSATRGQANLLVSQKIDKELRQRYKAIDREILEIKTGINETLVRFKNGSIIQVCVASENSRGYRAHIVIIDESRLVKKSVINDVIKPFLNVTRFPEFLRKPEYADKKEQYIEENKEIYLTSCGYKTEDTYKQFLDFKDKMLEGKEYFTCAVPYTVAVEHGLLTKARVEKMRSDVNQTQAGWLMEMEAVFYGLLKGAYYTIEEINACRTNKNIFYPPTTVEWISDKKKSWRMKKATGEIRIIGMDIALMGDAEEGKTKGKNDNTVMFCIRLIPDGESYERHVCYIESLNGEHAEKQAIRLKELYYDFECDYIALDCMGNGMSVYEYLNKTQYNDARATEYPPFAVYNDKSMASRAGKNAVPCVFSVKASAEFNHNIAMDLKDKITTRKLKLPEDDFFAKDRLEEQDSFAKLSGEAQARMLMPFLQTTALSNELVGLQMSIQNGFIKLKEKSTARKDRYSSLAYANYLGTLLERELSSETKNDDYSQYSQLW